MMKEYKVLLILNCQHSDFREKKKFFLDLTPPPYKPQIKLIQYITVAGLHIMVCSPHLKTKSQAPMRSQVQLQTCQFNAN